MATETETGLSGHMRGVTVTTLACLAGVLAGVASAALIGTSQAAATNVRSLFVLAGFVLIQFPVYKALGIDVEGFGPKDYLYVAFMTFALWFIAYAILLTSNASL
ncbi:MAG: hypothetical protein ABEJ30_02895 [Halorientalis sp.]